MKEKGKTEAESLYHFKLISHLRVFPDYKITIPKLCYHMTSKHCFTKLNEIRFENLLNIWSLIENKVIEF